MQSTPLPQRKATAKAAFNMVTAGVPDRKSRSTKPPQAPAPADPQPPVETPKEPAVLHSPVEAPGKPPMYRAGRQKKPLRPKPPPPTDLYKMSKSELINYCHVHHLWGYKGARKIELIFMVNEHMAEQVPLQPTDKHVAHLTQLAQDAPVNTLPVRVKKQPRLCK